MKPSVERLCGCGSRARCVVPADAMRQMAAKYQEQRRILVGAKG